jgi:hypothetical protein
VVCECSLDGEDKKCIQKFGEKTSLEMATWKTKKEMRR